MGEKVKVKAARFGTITSMVGAGVIHTNPKGSDPRARNPMVDEGDIQRLVDEGMIVAPSGYKKTPVADTFDDEEESDEIQGETLGREGARKTKEETDLEEAGEAPSGIGNRAAVAHQDPDAGGIDGSGLADDDPDAAPAPATAPAANRGKPGPKPKPR